MPGAFVLRFFAGFCLIANGAYIGVASFDNIGDAGTMLKHGSAPWQLWLFGMICVVLGLRVWHNQGRAFGLKGAKGEVSRPVAYATLVVCVLLLAVSLIIDGR